jgi:hypothetical protein
MLEEIAAATTPLPQGGEPAPLTDPRGAVMLSSSEN